MKAVVVGGARKPVGLGDEEDDAEGSEGYGIMLSTGPPLSQARTGTPQIIPSTGPIPKCSFVGV